MGTLDPTRAVVAGEAVGIAQGALDAAVAYTKERRQFGQPVTQFQGVQFMLADCKRLSETGKNFPQVEAQHKPGLCPMASFAGLLRGEGHATILSTRRWPYGAVALFPLPMGFSFLVGEF